VVRCPEIDRLTRIDDLYGSIGASGNSSHTSRTQSSGRSGHARRLGGRGRGGHVIVEEEALGLEGLGGAGDRAYIGGVIHIALFEGRARVARGEALGLRPAEGDLLASGVQVTNMPSAERRTGIKNPGAVVASIESWLKKPYLRHPRRRWRGQEPSPGMNTPRSPRCLRIPYHESSNDIVSILFLPMGHPLAAQL
jgi:hypothetical protein